MKLASAALAYKRSGKYRRKEAAAEGSRARQLQDQMKNYVMELVAHTG